LVKQSKQVIIIIFLKKVVQFLIKLKLIFSRQIL